MSIRLIFLAWFCALAPAQAQVRIGFIDPALPAETPRRNASALAFARTQGEAVRLKPLTSGGWQDAEGHLHAPEEFDVVWYHEGDNPLAAVGEGTCTDLRAFLEGGGTLLLSGAAGRLLNEMGIEPTPLRVLGPTDAAYASGIVVPERQRSHPAFRGLDAAHPVILTGLGGNALADFYGTEGPHGEMLADGNAGLGERPLVEYAVGAGRVAFVGWRLPDFTTAGDPYRPNLERLFGNLLRYLTERNANRARLIVPPGEARYMRLLGVPLLCTEKPVTFSAPAAEERYAVILTPEAAPQEGFPVEGGYLREIPLTDQTIRVQALGLTLSRRERPVSQYAAARRAGQESMESHDRAQAKGLRVIRPKVRFLPAPLKPLRMPRTDTSVLLGRSPFMAPGDGKGDIRPVYDPLEDGGFRISGSTRQLNRPIVHGQNRVWTGDVPLFAMDAVTGNGTYAEERVFPLWPRPDAAKGNVNPSLGTLRLGVPGPDGKPHWLDTFPQVAAIFRPGYTQYHLSDPKGGWKAAILIAPAMENHGLICRIQFDQETPLVWQYGGIGWAASEPNANRVEILGSSARITEAHLPGGLVLAGWDGEGQAQVLTASYGQQVEFSSATPRKVYHIVAVWGVTRCDEEAVRKTLTRLDTPISAAWPEARDHLKRLWLDCYIKPALDPEGHFHTLLASPEAALRRTCNWWDKRRQEFQIRTPDPHLNALINWARCVSEYHRQGPGLVLGAQIWQMYSHISTGWYGKEWGGDHKAIEENLRLYGAMQSEDGFIRWIAPSLVAFNAENNTPYWVDQVWRHYTWTGNRQFVRDMWPLVRKAVAWLLKQNDPDGDGLFRDWYEYWNCDSNGKGPKAAAPSAMAWAMLDRAARLAGVIGDRQAEREYRARAERTRKQIFKELWSEQEGRLGSVGADGIWRGHPQTWEEYLAINAGLLSPSQGRRAMRWLASHYGFEPQPGVHLLSCSDWWPIRWSVQWVPTGDTCLAALAGMKSGDIELWWPYLRTVVRSAFRSDFPGINMGISNAGAGGGDREDVDSDDPHTHVTVRGLFGIEPALHEGRLDICPAFPAGWRKVSIRTPDVSYEYRRQGNRATFRIRTPRPAVKRVRASLTGPEVVTPAETESLVTLPIGPPMPPPKPSRQKPILAEQESPQGDLERAHRAILLKPEEIRHQVLFDLADAFNQTIEEMISTGFIFDYADSLSPLGSWWGNPTMTMPPSPRMVAMSTGVRFLTAGRPRLGKPLKNLLTLSSWRPYPLPGGAVIPVGLRCERLWLLLQSYVHPMKNYIPNGEVLLRYKGGKQEIVSLIPPLNLDCYFQHFSRQGVPLPLGRLSPGSSGFSFVHQGLSKAHADALEIRCDPLRVLESVELRATCSEGVLGLAGMTALAVEGKGRATTAQYFRDRYAR